MKALKAKLYAIFRIPIWIVAFIRYWWREAK